MEQRQFHAANLISAIIWVPVILAPGYFAAGTMGAQDQKQAAMVAAVQESGLQPQRFNQIAQAAQADKALSERVQVAAARQVQAAQPKP